MKILKYRLLVKHDNGTAKITTSATSKQAAIEKICRAENCPPAAIVKAELVKPTIYEIKRFTEETAPYFFTAKTLRFFGQTMKSFKVERHGDDKFKISAPIIDRYTGRIMGETVRYYNPATDTLEHQNQQAPAHG